jgi:cell division protein FtsZ
MPRIDELPVPAQNELRVMRGEAPPVEPPQKQRMGLLQRLASVGLGNGRREDEGQEAQIPQAPQAQQPPRPRMGPIPQAPARPMQPRPAPRPPESRQPESRPAEPPVSEYARRPAHQGLDPLGRQAPVHNSSEEDQLDIPAFLRRQAK